MLYPVQPLGLKLKPNNPSQGTSYFRVFVSLLVLGVSAFLIFLRYDEHSSRTEAYDAELQRSLTQVTSFDDLEFQVQAALLDPSKVLDHLVDADQGISTGDIKFKISFNSTTHPIDPLDLPKYFSVVPKMSGVGSKETEVCSFEEEGDTRSVEFCPDLSKYRTALQARFESSPSEANFTFEMTPCRNNSFNLQLNTSSASTEEDSCSTPEAIIALVFDKQSQLSIKARSQTLNQTKIKEVFSRQTAYLQTPVDAQSAAEAAVEYKDFFGGLKSTDVVDTAYPTLYSKPLLSFHAIELLPTDLKTVQLNFHPVPLWQGTGAALSADSEGQEPEQRAHRPRTFSLLSFSIIDETRPFEDDQDEDGSGSDFGNSSDANEPYRRRLQSSLMSSSLFDAISGIVSPNSSDPMDLNIGNLESLGDGILGDETDSSLSTTTGDSLPPADDGAASENQNSSNSSHSAADEDAPGNATAPESSPSPAGNLTDEEGIPQNSTDAPDTMPNSTDSDSTGDANSNLDDTVHNDSSSGSLPNSTDADVGTGTNAGTDAGDDDAAAGDDDGNDPAPTNTTTPIFNTTEPAPFDNSSLSDFITEEVFGAIFNETGVDLSQFTGENITDINSTALADFLANLTLENVTSAIGGGLNSSANATENTTNAEDPSASNSSASSLGMNSTIDEATGNEMNSFNASSNGSSISSASSDGTNSTDSTNSSTSGSTNTSTSTTGNSTTANSTNNSSSLVLPHKHLSDEDLLELFPSCRHIYPQIVDKWMASQSMTQTLSGTATGNETDGNSTRPLQGIQARVRVTSSTVQKTVCSVPDELLVQSIVLRQWAPLKARTDWASLGLEFAVIIFGLYFFGLALVAACEGCFGSPEDAALEDLVALTYRSDPALEEKNLLKPVTTRPGTVVPGLLKGLRLSLGEKLALSVPFCCCFRLAKDKRYKFLKSKQVLVDSAKRKIQNGGLDWVETLKAVRYAKHLRDQRKDEDAHLRTPGFGRDTGFDEVTNQFYLLKSFALEANFKNARRKSACSPASSSRVVPKEVNDSISISNQSINLSGYLHQGEDLDASLDRERRNSRNSRNSSPVKERNYSYAKAAFLPSQIHAQKKPPSGKSLVPPGSTNPHTGPTSPQQRERGDSPGISYGKTLESSPSSKEKIRAQIIRGSFEKRNSNPRF